MIDLRGPFYQNLERAEGRLRTVLFAALRDLEQRPEFRQFIKGSKRAAIREVLNYLNFDRALDPIVAPLVRTYVAQAKAAREGLLLTVGQPVRWVSVYPATVEAARREAAKLITELGKRQKAAYRAMLIDAAKKGTSVDDIAKRLRQSIGLHSRQVRALNRYRDGLGDLSIRARNVLVDRMKARMIRRRALTIARTEAARFTNLGQGDVFREAKQAGTLGETSVRVWMTTADERTCPICEPMDGQERGLDEDFDSSYNGDSAADPPIHPNCRCTTAIRPDPRSTAEKVR